MCSLSRIKELEAENANLRAELAAAKKAPKTVYVVSERYEHAAYVFSYPPAYWANAAPYFDVDKFIVDEFAEDYPEHAQRPADRGGDDAAKNLKVEFHDGPQTGEPDPLSIEFMIRRLDENGGILTYEVDGVTRIIRVDAPASDDGGEQ